MRALLPLILLSPVLTAQAGDLSLNVYGLSHHGERAEAKRIGADHEFNPGLGLR